MNLMTRKLVVAFMVGFVPVFLTGLLGLLQSIAEGTPDWSVTTSLLIALIAGAGAAGLRAAIAVFTDFIPSDRLHGFGNRPTSVTVTKAGTLGVIMTLIAFASVFASWWDGP